MREVFFRGEWVEQTLFEFRLLDLRAIESQEAIPLVQIRLSLDFIHAATRWNFDETAFLDLRRQLLGPANGNFILADSASYYLCPHRKVLRWRVLSFGNFDVNTRSQLTCGRRLPIVSFLHDVFSLTAHKSRDQASLVIRGIDSNLARTRRARNTGVLRGRCGD